MSFEGSCKWTQIWAHRCLQWILGVCLRWEFWLWVVGIESSMRMNAGWYFVIGYAVDVVLELFRPEDLIVEEAPGLLEVGHQEVIKLQELQDADGHVDVARNVAVIYAMAITSKVWRPSRCRMCWCTWWPPSPPYPNNHVGWPPWSSSWIWPSCRPLRVNIYRWWHTGLNEDPTNLGWLGVQISEVHGERYVQHVSVGGCLHNDGSIHIMFPVSQSIVTERSLSEVLFVVHAIQELLKYVCVCMNCDVPNRADWSTLPLGAFWTLLR